MFGQFSCKLPQLLKRMVDMCCSPVRCKFESASAVLGQLQASMAEGCSCKLEVLAAVGTCHRFATRNARFLIPDIEED